MKFLKIAKLLEKIENTDSRLEMTDYIHDFIKNSDIDSAQIFSYFLEGRVAPLFIDAEFNFSEKSIINVLKDYVKLNGLDYRVEEKRDELGDIGLVVEDILQTMSDRIEVSLELDKVYSVLWEIVLEEGHGTVERKSKLLVELLDSVTSLEAKFIVKIVAGKLRIGVNVKTVLDALSILLVQDKSMRETLDKAYGFSSDIGYLIYYVKKGKDVNEIEPTPGIPFSPRLVQRVGNLEEGVERMLEDNDGFYVQPKFDGLRCQIHKGVDYGGEIFENRVWVNYFLKNCNHEVSLFENKSEDVKLFSRNLEDLTDMFPEIVQAVKDLSCDSCILDSEIVAVDKVEVNEGEINYVEFQKVMTRRRKYGVSKQSNDVPVVSMIFDILELNADNVASCKIGERVELIRELLKSDNLYLRLSDTPLISKYSELEDLFNKYVNRGLEGLIIKREGTEYIPGVRDYDWIKLKKSIQSKVVDTLDLVVLGYYYGSGKQTKFGMGALLLGTYSRKLDKFIPISKLGTGVTDEQWKSISQRLKELDQFESRPGSILKGEYQEPDIWLDPEVVVEVEADEITRSSNYDPGKEYLDFGLSLRFPRLKIFDRSKAVRSITTVKEIVDMWRFKSE